MPLARIITRTPQAAVSAADYLRSEGYTVEMISPGDFRVTPAELELNLDRVPAGEAVERARRLLTAHRAGTPSAHAESTPTPSKEKVAIAYDIAGRPVEFEDEGERILERRKARNTLGRALVAMLRRGEDWANVRLERAWSSAAAISRRRMENRAFRQQSEAAREQEEIRLTEQLARERVRRDVEQQQQERMAAERRAQEEARIAAERAAAKTADEERQRARAEAERAAAHQRVRLEAERHAEEDEQARIAAVHEAMIAAQRQSEPHPAEPSAVSPVAEEPAAAPAPEPAATIVPAPAEAAPPAIQSPPQGRSRRPFVIRRRRPSRRVQKALAAACGVGFLVLMGLVAYANRRPAAPLSPSALTISGWTKQEVPFGKSIITPPAPLRPAPAAVAKPAAPAVPKPSPAATKPAPKPAPVRPAARPSRLTAQHNSAAEDEVIVRHVRPSPAPRTAATTSAASTAKLKRYSDLE